VPGRIFDLIPKRKFQRQCVRTLAIKKKFVTAGCDPGARDYFSDQLCVLAS
jgi:hypothetical protein